MAIITVLSGSFCHGDEIISKLSGRLGYELLDEKLLAATSEYCGISSEKLERILSGANAFRDRFARDHQKIQARLEATLAKLIQSDNLILSGCAGFLIPGNIAHVLKVCIIADLSYRVSQAVVINALSKTDAANRIQEDDSRLSACTMSFVRKPAYDEELYDLVIPMDKTAEDEAVRIICQQAASDAIKTTDWSRAAARDFLLSSRVKVALTDAGHNVDVFSENGHVVIGINEQAFRMRRLEEKLKRLASEVEGVTEITTKLGTKFSPPSINPWDSIDTPPKILLVDDEKEFVQTLSERLKTRNLGSSIAYDGEQALEMVDVNRPDVIVLDLKMPGIDGIETLRRLKQAHPDVEVIILTGHGSDLEQERAEELGAFAYLRKPVNVNELAQVMKEAYARQQENR